MSHRADDIGPSIFSSNAIFQRTDETNKSVLYPTSARERGEGAENLVVVSDPIDILKSTFPTILEAISKNQSQSKVKETTGIDSSSAPPHPPQPITEVHQNQSQSGVEEATSIGDRPQAITEIYQNLEQAEVGDTTRINNDAVNVQNIPLSDVLLTTPRRSTIAEKYTRTMLKCLAGYPLYEPTPFSELSKRYLREGIRAGDVGFIREDGTFDFLFNIRPSQNDEINPPDLQSLILQESEDVGVSSSKKTVLPTRLFHDPVKEKRICRLGCTRYTCSEPEGAILELPEGTTRFEVIKRLPFKELAIRCGVEWYKYTMTRGRDITNGSLYLVTSYTKCTHWGIAVVNRPCACWEGLRFVRNKRLFCNRNPKYKWKGSNSAFTTTVAPTPEGSVPNQCVFLGGYKIRLREDIWNGLVEERLRGNSHKPTASSSLHQAGNTREPRNQDHHRQREIGRGTGPCPRTSKPATDADRHAEELANSDIPMVPPATESGKVTLQADFDPPPVHPSDLINVALLSQEPGAKIAITHDDAWCNLLGDIFLYPEPLDLAKIAQSYTSLIDKYGCISFEKASDLRSCSEVETSPPFQRTGFPTSQELNQQQGPASSDKDHRMLESGQEGTSQSSTTTTPISLHEDAVDENNHPRQELDMESVQDWPSTTAAEDNTHLPTPQMTSAILGGVGENGPPRQELESPAPMKSVQDRPSTTAAEDNTHFKATPQMASARLGGTDINSASIHSKPPLQDINYPVLHPIQQRDRVAPEMQNQHQRIEQHSADSSSQLMMALTTFNFLVLILLLTSYILDHMRPCSPPSYLPLGYEQLDPGWACNTMVVSCRVVSLRRRWFGLFGRPVPIIDCTPSSCPNQKTTTSTDSSPCQCPDRSDPSSTLAQLLTEAETLDYWTKGSGSGHVVEVSSNPLTENTAVETTSTTAETPHVTAETTITSTDAEIMGESAPEETADQEFKYWIAHSGLELADEIASKLGTENKDIDIETAKELLTSLEPPPPPSGTVPGYNPWLDKARPTTIEEYLRNFEVVFVVDDSKSMKGERWTETRDALETIAKKTFQLKVDTVSLRFLNNASYVRGLRGKKKLMSWFNKVKPRGNTPLGRRLNVVFDEHLDRVDSAVREGPEKYSKIPPLDIIVLTDGIPTDKGEDEPTRVVAKAVKRLNDSHYHPNTMGVQIVQIANEDKAKKMLRDLVVGDNGRIVDTVPYAGVVDSKKLLRILLGGVHPNIRSQLPVAMLAFEQQHE